MVSSTIPIAWEFAIHCCIWPPKEHGCHPWYGWKVCSSSFHVFFADHEVLCMRTPIMHMHTHILGLGSGDCFQYTFCMVTRGKALPGRELRSGFVFVLDLSFWVLICCSFGLCLQFLSMPIWSCGRWGDDTIGMLQFSEARNILVAGFVFASTANFLLFSC